MHGAHRWAWDLASTAASCQGSSASVWTASRSSASHHTHMRICDTRTRCLSGGPARAARVSDWIRVWCRACDTQGPLGETFFQRHRHMRQRLCWPTRGSCASYLDRRMLFSSSCETRILMLPSDFRDGDVDRACTRSRRSATICQMEGKHRSRP